MIVLYSEKKKQEDYIMPKFFCSLFSKNISHVKYIFLQT